MNQKLELQILSTGHFAPWDDNDIAENNRLSGKFPHCPIVHLPPLDKIEAGRTVIDAGAFIGDNTLEFTLRGWSVIAFEPFFDAFTCARLNAPLARLFHGAVGDGRKVMLNHECPGTNHGMRSLTPDGGGTPTICIDSLGLTDCAFIKIDVEGFEPFALAGARETIAKFRPILYVEANPIALNRYGWTTDTLADLIRSLGYTLEVIGGQPNFDWMCRPTLKLK